MTGHERVREALRHRKTKQVPKLLYGETIGYVPAIERLLRDRCGGAAPRHYFSMDITGVGLNPSRLDTARFAPWFGERSTEAEQSGEIDEWGVWWKGGRYFHFSHIESPLANCSSVEEIASFPQPDLLEPYRARGLKERMGQLHDEGFAVAAYAGSIFEQSWFLRGIDVLMMDMIINPDIAHFLFRRAADYQRRLGELFAAAGVDIVMTGDDVANQRGLTMSVSMWKDFLGPLLSDTVSAIKHVNPDTAVFYHSCGKLDELIPHLIETGIDILNPIQPDCMDPAEIYRTYGRQITLWGSISVQQTMPFGTPEDVTREVEDRLSSMGEHGGLILSPAHVLGPETPWENIVAFFNAVENHR
jgi:uroporphyrinogen decarboxylase